MRLLPLAVLGLLVSAAPASAAFSFKAFHTPSGNITCVASGDRATNRNLGLRCDITRHTWRAPKQTKPCDAGDYGSSLGLSRRGKARFICVSDAPPKSHRLAYGKLWKFGPFSCRVRIAGLRCTNAAKHGWFLSKASYKRF
jgi:hypothetical protein